MKEIHALIENDRIKYEKERKQMEINHNNKMNFINMDYQIRMAQINQNNNNYYNYNNMNLNQAPPSIMNYSDPLSNNYNLISLD